MLKVLSKKFENQKGLTLIEIIVSVGVFSIVVVGITGIFISAVKTQKHTLSAQEVLDQTSYALEYMGRTIRMAKKDSGGTCITADCNYENPDDPIKTSIRFLKHDEDSGLNLCREFLLEDHQLKEKKSSDHTSVNLPETGTALTSSDVHVSSVTFKLLTPCETDNAQPRVTISLNIRTTAIEQKPEIKIQTSFSQRELNIQE